VGDRRAIGTQEKNARRQQMLDAAADLLRDWSFTDITMQRIADRSGVAKGTLYLYFSTKEELFLALLEQGLTAWYSELGDLADRASGNVSPASAARVIASTLSARPILVHLYGLLHSTFGGGIDLESILDFRRRQHRIISTLAPALARRVAGLSESSASRFLVRLEIVIGGLAWTAFPSQTVAQILREEDLAVFLVDFELELTEILSALLTRASAGAGV
jgi:AcrR family transcriptional regulator